jgi:outer membrane lipoprotein-sorting protein
MKTQSTLVLALFAFLTFFVPAAGMAAANDDIARIENYLQNLDTLKADFTQIAYDGSRTTGTFYLNRPGKLRFEYDDSDDFIVADGIFIYYYDSEMKQQSNTTIGNSLADFLLRKNIRLDGDIKVTDMNRKNGYLNATISLREDPAAGSLILTLDENPMKLIKWQVIDSQNLTTEIRLDNIETDIRLARDLFFYIDPVRRGSSYN